MEPTPKVSLCVLTYNRASILPRSLDGLLRQTYQDFEIVINDDCSPDNTAEVGRAYEAKDPRVRYFRNEQNLRYAGNQNIAVQRARAEYIAFIHDGDIYREDMLEKWMASLERHPSAAFVFNAQGVLDHDGRMIRVHQPPFAEFIPGLRLFDYCILRQSIPVWGILLVRKSCLVAAGPFEREFPVLADVDMWLRLLLRHDCAYVCEPLFSLAPREEGHQNAGINWRITTEIERIYWRNLKRRMALGGLGSNFLLIEMTFMLKCRWLVQFAACVTNGRGIKAIQGVRHLIGFKARRRLEYGQ